MAGPYGLGVAWTNAGLDAMRGWLALQETLLASQAVIARRSELIADAASNPAEADFAELGRMVWEKGPAFALAGMAWAKDWQALQTAWAGQMLDMVRVATGGAPSTRGTARLNRAAARAMGAGGRAIAPLHRAATANARRLSAGTTNSRR